MIMKSNYFFLLPNSPWPLITSVGSFNLLFSVLMLFKFGSFSCLTISIISLTMVSFYWWMNYSKELGLIGNSSSSLESGLKLAMILFISSEVFFFFSFFWGYFHYLLSPCMEIGLLWPPQEIMSFDFINVPLINTLILMSSGVTVTMSHHYLLVFEWYKFYLFLFLTVFLGFVFTTLQSLEYNSSFFSVSDGSFGTSFFMLTGFHGMHVIIGSIFLLCSLMISSKMNSNSSNLLSFEMSSWYWHFVDVVWIFLYFFLYYMTS